MIQKFNFMQTNIPGLFLITPFCSWDKRGKFIKDYSGKIFDANQAHHPLKEIFYTVSHKGVLRGMHFQGVMQQAKLVRCIHGHIWDVIVDLRKDSLSFGKWQAFDLTEENMCELLVPAGCAHGYLVLEEAIVSYKCAEDFYGEYDDGICWNDSDIGIKWPLDLIGGEKNLILSEKDSNLQSFRDFVETYGGF